MTVPVTSGQQHYQNTASQLQKCRETSFLEYPIAAIK